MFTEARDDGSGGDNWSYKSCKAPVKSSPPTHQHSFFYRPDALPDLKASSDAKNSFWIKSHTGKIGQFSTGPVNRAIQSFRKYLREYTKAGGGDFEHLL